MKLDITFNLSRKTQSNSVAKKILLFCTFITYPRKLCMAIASPENANAEYLMQKTPNNIRFPHNNIMLLLKDLRLCHLFFLQNASKVVALLLSHRASTDLLWSGHSPLSLAIASGNDLVEHTHRLTH